MLQILFLVNMFIFCTLVGLISIDMIQDNNLSYDDINVDPNTGNATNRIYSIEYQKNLETQYKYTYTYDASHNITNIVVTDGSVPPNTIDRYDYYYDGFNQLVREDIHVKINLAGEYSKSITYTYDYQGNITHIKEYNYSNGSLSGTPLKEKKLYYANAWGDQVTKTEYYVSGTLSYYESYSYDNSGNLIQITDSRTSYYNDYLNWDGRSLVSRGQYCETDSYQYNDQGIRTKKTVATCSGTTLTNYILDGDKVLVETWGSNTIYYTYDVDGTLLSMNYNGNEYFYITNMQGDIIELVDISGNTVVEYKYDAWGNIISQTGGALAEINPYRYRGYRFDEETGFYYLNSRYYNPVIGRFISSDGLLGKQGDTIGHNMYAYCANNPVMHTDSTGYWFGFDDIFTGPIDEILVLGLLALAAALGIPGTSDALGDLTSTIGDTINKISDGINAEKEKLSALLEVLVIKNLSSRGKHDWHHIVAQKDPRAALSRIMLARCNIDVNSIDNMVSVCRPMHWVMHTTGYHASVTVLLWTSYGIAGVDGVKTTLAAIKIIIETASGNIG